MVIIISFRHGINTLATGPFKLVIIKLKYDSEHLKMTSHNFVDYLAFSLPFKFQTSLRIYHCIAPLKEALNFLIFKFKTLQCPPVNWNTLGWIKSDKLNRIIQLPEETLLLKNFASWKNDLNLPGFYLCTIILAQNLKLINDVIKCLIKFLIH